MAVRDGRMVPVTSVPLGAACGCVCPKCGENVIAKNRDYDGRKTQMHFAHARDSECARQGGETAPESALHQVAKDIVTDSLGIMTPALEIFPEAMQVEFRRAFPAARVPFRSAVKEPWRPAVQSGQDMRPDVVGTTEKGQEIHLEFKVAHPVPAEKAAAALREQRWMLEIDLGRFRGSEVNVDELRKFILQSAQDRVWLSHGPRFNLKERLSKASDFPGQCPLGLPKALNDGICRSCPCRLSSVSTIRRGELQCTGHTRVTDLATLVKWENREQLPLPRFVANALAAKRRQEAAEERRRENMVEVNRTIVKLGAQHAAIGVARERLRELVQRVANMDRRLKTSRQHLQEQVGVLEKIGNSRTMRLRTALKAIRTQLEPAQRRLKSLQEAEDARIRLSEFRKLAMREYQAGSRPVLCPHCQQPVQGRFRRDGKLEEIEKCECLFPMKERTPSPTLWAAARRRRLLENHIRDL